MNKGRGTAYTKFHVDLSKDLKHTFRVHCINSVHSCRVMNSPCEY
jgi:hypothetical protein